MIEKKKIMIAMSGGVDSSVAAALLVKEGHEVIGGYMKNWTGDDCDWKSERRDAMRVASQLGIELHTFDFENEYKDRVYEYMIKEYEAGRTPNPDVMCNSEVKFDLLLKAAEEMGCEYLATGHYARTEGGRLFKGVDQNKDQSYFLCRLTAKELNKVLFPVGELKKNEVRKKAETLGLSTAQKKDSQGLCFVGKVDMPTFLKDRIKVQKGNIVTVEGEVIGEHEGIQFYTIGQRKGIGVGGTEPYYVVERRKDTNELVVAHDGHESLFSEGLVATDLSWVHQAPLESDYPMRLKVKIRYRQEDQECEVTKEEDGEVGGALKIIFKEKQRSVAPGQFIAFYDGVELVGSGVIDRTLDKTPVNS